MGKGDKKTRRGKIFLGSFGNTHPKKSKVRKEKRNKAKAKAEVK